MTWKNKHIKALFFLVLLSVGGIACNAEPEPVFVPEPDPVYHSLEYVISASALVELLEKDASVRLLDIRKPEQFAAGHLQGAINLWRPEITSKNYPYGGMALSRDSLAMVLGQKGVSSNQKLVFYDGKGGSDAVRMWFLMRCYGHSNLLVLDGGLMSWKAELDTVPTAHLPTTFAFSGAENPSMIIHKEEVLSALNDTNIIFVDTRSNDEFTGNRLKKGATKSGRIPNSISWDWGNAVLLGQNGQFKSAKDLQYEMDSLGISRKKQIIVYCHTGVRSAHTYFVLTELLGYPNVRNYDGSWSEWSYFEDLPFETEFETPEITR